MFLIGHLGRTQSAAVRAACLPSPLGLRSQLSHRTRSQVEPSSVLKYVPKVQHRVIWQRYWWSRALGSFFSMNLTFAKASE